MGRVGQQIHQFCIVLRGPAGAGKSSLAREVQRGVASKVAVVDTDIFNWQTVPGEDDKSVVFENVLAVASNYLGRGYSVVVEGLIITSEERGAIQKLRERAEKRGAAFVDFYCLVPEQLAIERNRQRDRSVSDETVAEWWSLAERDRKDVKGPLVDINTSGDLGECAGRVLEHVKRAAKAMEGEQR